MNPLLWVAVGLVVYTAFGLALNRTGYVPDSIHLTGPLTTIRTRRGRVLLDRLATPRRFWRAWSNVGVGIALVVMVGTFALLVVQGLAILRNPPAPTAVNRPRNYLVIPGVNDFLPLSVAPEILLGLLVGLVVHEGGHGLLCRVEDIDIESMGVLTLAVIPIGAFVEPDEESQRAADRGARTRMFAAGVTNNFAVAAIGFVLIFGPVIGAITVAPGVPVADAYGGTPADSAGVDRGDRITHVAGTRVDSRSELDAALASADEPRVEVTVNGERTRRLERSLAVVGTVSGNPANLTVDPRGEAIPITTVDGEPVYTRGGFRRLVADRPVATIQTGGGERTFPVGAAVTVAPDGALAEAGAPTNRSLVVTRVGGSRVTAAEELTTALSETEPGQQVSVATYRSANESSRQVYNVTLHADPSGDSGFLGVQVFPGTSGVVVTDFGIEPYPAGTFLELLGGSGGPDAQSPVETGGSLLLPVYIALVLPLASTVLGLPNFPGFTGYWTNFYTVSGPLGLLGADAVFLLFNALFWTAWVNFQLGLFNCIPGYPLDGGRILRAGVEAVVARLPVEAPERVVRTITTGTGVVMLAALLLMLFGPELLN